MRFSYHKIKKSFHNQEPWVNVLFFKYITIPITYLIVNFTKITPNIISLISLVLGVSSAYFYFKGAVFLGGFLYFFSYIFDAIDGKVARVTNSGKPYGAWLDMAIDRINLVLISTAISYNYYVVNNDMRLIFLNSIFLGLSFIGSESRYFINMYKLKNHIKKKETLSKYEQWCIKKGFIKEPLSLVELFLFYLIVAPQFGIEYLTIIFTLLFLILRILKQQFFWYYVSKR